MIATHVRDFVLSDCVTTLVRVRARRLCHCPGFCPTDCDDLQQELLLRVLRRLDRFDPRRGALLTFIRHLVKRSASHILRGQRSLKRAGTLGALLIDGTVLNVHGKSIPIGETVSEEDGRRRTGARPTSGIEQLERSEAIAHAYCALSLSERDVWSLLTRRTPTAAAREMATSRRQVRNIMAVIRCQLESAGLRNSWKN